MMVSMWKRNLDEPRAVGLALHRVRNGIPGIEITHQVNLFRFRRDTDEVDRLDHFLGRITIIREMRTCRIHWR